jgi:hypothetical protein
MRFPCFVWIETAKEGEPAWQIWWHEAASKREGKPIIVLASHELSEEEQRMTPDDLRLRYPPPPSALVSPKRGNNK